MSGQIRRPMGSLALVATLLMWGAGIGAPMNTARADDCLGAPNSPAPQGSHWYYHIDRATQSKCWYVRAADQPAQQATAPAASDASAATPKKPASASAPLSIMPGDSTPASPRIKVLAVKNQDAPVSSATADQPVRQGAQKDSSASPLAERAAPQASPSSQMSDQAPAPASATGPAWPDPGVPAVKTPELVAAPSDSRTQSGQPAVDAAAPDKAESTAQDSAAVAEAEMPKSPRSRSATSWPIAIFPLAALGLVVAGFLFRIVMKMSVGRRQPVLVDRRDFDWIGDRHQDELGADQFVHQPDGVADHLQRSAMWASVDSGPSRSDHGRRDDVHGDATSGTTDKIGRGQRRRSGSDARKSDWIGKLVDDLQSPLMVASDYRSGPPLQDDDSWPNDERRNGDTPSRSGAIREREEMLEQLRQNLDRLLRSPKVA